MTGSDRRVSAALLVAVIAGVVAFAWPLFLRPESGVSAAQAPILFALVLILRRWWCLLLLLLLIRLLLLWL